MNQNEYLKRINETAPIEPDGNIDYSKVSALSRAILRGNIFKDEKGNAVGARVASKLRPMLLNSKSKQH